MNKVRDYEFGARIDHRACKPINTKVDEKWHGVRTCTYYNFGKALYLYNTRVGQKGHGVGNMANHPNRGTPLYLWNG